MGAALTGPEGREAVQRRVMLRGLFLSDIDANGISEAFGHDPLLIALHEPDHQPQPERVIEQFIDTSVGRLTIQRGEYTASDYRTALRSMAGVMLSQLELSPSWPAPTHLRSFMPCACFVSRAVRFITLYLRPSSIGLLTRKPTHRSIHTCAGKLWPRYGAQSPAKLSDWSANSRTYPGRRARLSSGTVMLPAACNFALMPSQVSGRSGAISKSSTPRCALARNLERTAIDRLLPHPGLESGVRIGPDVGVLCIRRGSLFPHMATSATAMHRPHVMSRGQ